MNINTEYMGLSLPSPIIAGSCGLTSSIENLKTLEASGVGAIVLKSLFEEQISHEVSKNNSIYTNGEFQEAYDYVGYYTKDENIGKYLSLIREAKSQLKIPIIASINCITHSEWLLFAKRVEDAGADALELNIFTLPADVNTSHEDIEHLFMNIASSLKKIIHIPIAIKTGFYFSDMAKFMQRLSWTGIQSIVLFNRSFNIDFDVDTDLDNPVYKSVNQLSSPVEFSNTLRWAMILSPLLRCDLSATTGVKTGEDVVKLLLAGAQTVQVASCLYTNGLKHISTMNNELKTWMEKHKYQSIRDFKGKLSIKASKHPAAILRVQFMKYFSEIN